MTAFQKIARPTDLVIFICADCGRQHNSPTADVPKGWALIAMDCCGAPFVRCPDCAASAAQAQHDRMTDYMATMHRPKVDPLRKLTLHEHTALTFLAGRAHAMTVQVANACGLIVSRRCLPQARNMLRRLERWGYITHGNTPAGHYATYSITDAGRRVVQP